MSVPECKKCGTALQTEEAACASCLLQLGLTVAASENPDGLLSKPGEVESFSWTGEIDQKYRLLEVIGEGAFGTVWEAEQFMPVRRHVAVKVLKLGMDTREVVARFEAERQALALMDHPNIAKVFDGGTTSAGRPYFVMELVRGVPVNRYCDENGLRIRERIALFIEICQAVQHAHQKGVIHRDLKPSNIIVSGQAGRHAPKVIDFGIAKAIGTELTDRTLFTRHCQILGTPAYMSPEQSVLGSQDIDTRTDIYSLGAVLYELIVGAPPREAGGLDGLRRGESWRKAAETVPAIPSFRLRSMDRKRVCEVAHSRNSRAEELLRAVHGELDWITMKALETDRARRYESASAFALDLHRFLVNEPVSAGPPLVSYRVRKFVRKHQVVVWTSLGFAVILLAAVVASIVFALEANEGRRQAMAARESELLRVREAQEARETLRRRVYASDMGLVQDAIDANNLARARELLLRYRPLPGESDLRNWEWRYLWASSQVRTLGALPTHQKPIRSLAVSRSGRWLAWGGEAGHVGIWDLVENRPLKTLESGAGDPAVVTFSPVDDVLAASVKRGLVKVWKAGAWDRSINLLQAGWTRALCFSPDGDSLACMTDALHVGLWHPFQTNQIGDVRIGVLKDNYKSRMAFAPKEPWLALGETDGTIRILGLPNFDEKLSFRGVRKDGRSATDGITALTFSVDCEAVVSAAGYNDFAIRIWRPSDGSRLGELEGHSGWVTALTFSPDGKTLASASVDQTIRLWDWRSRTQRAILRGHQHEVWTIAFSPDSRTLASGSRAGEVFLWDSSAATPDVNPAIADRENIRQAVFSPDSKAIVAWHWDGAVSWRNVTTLTDKRFLSALGTNNYGVILSPDGRALAAGSRTGVVRLFDVKTAREGSSLSSDLAGRMLPVAYTRDGSNLLGVARVTPAPVCFLWEISSGRLINSWPVDERNHRVAISGNGRLVATGGFDGTVRLWETRSGKELANLGTHQTEVLGLQFSPDDQVLASASSLGDVILWDIRSRTSLTVLRSQAGAIYSLGFSPDGRRLVTGGDWQRAIQIWDLGTRQLISTLSAQGALHENVTFSPNGDSLLSVNSDGDLLMWTAQPLPMIDAQLLQ